MTGIDNNWGQASFEAQQFAEAEGPLNRSLRAHPEDAGIRAMLGISQYAVHDFQRALETLQPIVALDLSAVSDLEYTALMMLIESEKRQRDHGLRVWLVGMNPHVLDVVQRSQLGKALGRDDMHFNLEIAVAKYLGTALHHRE